MSNSVRPQGRQPTRLPCPWDSPGKNTGVGCHFLLQGMKVKSESEDPQSCPTLSDPMDCSPPGSSVHGIFQAGVLEWGCHCCLNRKKLRSNSVAWYLPENSQGGGLAGRALRELSRRGTGSSPWGPERRDGQEQQIFSLRAQRLGIGRHGGGCGVEAGVWQRARSRPASHSLALSPYPPNKLHTKISNKGHHSIAIPFTGLPFWILLLLYFPFHFFSFFLATLTDL